MASARGNTPNTTDSTDAAAAAAAQPQKWARRPSATAGSQSGRPADMPLLERAKSLALTLKFPWFLGHFFSVLFTILYFTKSSKDGADRKFFYLSMLSSAATYFILMLRDFQEKRKTKSPTDSALALVETLNAHYFLLAFSLLLARNPCFAPLVPFICYAIFHVSRYIADILLPVLVPDSPLAKAVATKIRSLDASVQPRAVRFGVSWEVCAVPPVILFQWVTGSQSLLLVLMYVQYLSATYSISPMVRAQFAALRNSIDACVAPLAGGENRYLGYIAQSWFFVRDFLVRVGAARYMRPAPAGAASQAQKAKAS